MNEPEVPEPERPEPERREPERREPERLWEPAADWLTSTHIGRFTAWLSSTGRGNFTGYDDLYAWSIADVNGFWLAVWEFFDVQSDRVPTTALASPVMPGALWFEGCNINYAEHALRHRRDGAAIISASQTRSTSVMSWDELIDAVGRARAGLIRLGVVRGDRVAAYLPNISETVVAFLATASLGAIWTCCAPEFGTQAVLDRLTQVAPKVLFVCDGYRHGARDISRTDEVATICAALPELQATVHVSYLDPASHAPSGAIGWADLLAVAVPVEFDRVPFDHPLWIVYSSGTTGLPKPIVHGHGVLLEYLKALSLHGDLGPDDRFMWFTTTGWIMWNYVVSALLVGSTIVLFDGDPGYPDLSTLWRLAERERVTSFGAGAGFFMNCRQAELRPARRLGLSELRTIGSTGSPLPPEGYRWIADEFGPRVMQSSISGGTDVCCAFVLGAPNVPVWLGEMSCHSLGTKVEAFDEHGHSVVGVRGELVVTAPMPSMPVAFWGDHDGSRLKSAYFDTYPGVWRHGDWITITERGSCTISGRSDATLNRGGVRIGTSEVYRVVEAVEGVVDSLIVHLEDASGVGSGQLILFVALAPNCAVVPVDAIRTALRSNLSPRHVPDRIHQLASIPTTLTGKKLEIPVKRVLLGARPDDVASRGALRDPAALDAIANFVDEA
ncbi:MAG: acetoacetate--CoA ligase [Ilumatobacteraceae bacterium]